MIQYLLKKFSPVFVCFLSLISVSAHAELTFEQRSHLCSLVYLNHGAFSPEIAQKLENLVGEELMLYASLERRSFGIGFYRGFADWVRKNPEEIWDYSRIFSELQRTLVRPAVEKTQPSILKIAQSYRELTLKGSPHRIPDVQAIPAWSQFVDTFLTEYHLILECAQSARSLRQTMIGSSSSLIPRSPVGFSASTSIAMGVSDSFGGKGSPRFPARVLFQDPDLVPPSPHYRHHTPIITEAHVEPAWDTLSVMERNLAKAKKLQFEDETEFKGIDPVTDQVVLAKRPMHRPLINRQVKGAFFNQEELVSRPGYRMRTVVSTPIGESGELLSNAHVRIGFAESLGKGRKFMEDAKLAQWFEGEANPLLSLGIERVGVVGVFDGHGKNQDLANDWISKSAAWVTPQVLLSFLSGLTAEQMADSDLVRKTIENAFSEESQHADVPRADGKLRKSIQQELTHYCDSLGYRGRAICRKMGTTAVVALLLDDRVFIAQLGDSRAIHVGSDRSVTRYSWDHSPDDYEEAKRVILAGGGVAPEHFGMGARIQGGLAMSRSLGDWDYEPYLIHIPDVSLFSIRESGATALILECDGVHNFFSYDTKVGEEVHQILTSGGSAGDAALDVALVGFASQNERTGGDNVTTLVVQFLGGSSSHEMKKTSELSGGSEGECATGAKVQDALEKKSGPSPEGSSGDGGF